MTDNTKYEINRRYPLKEGSCPVDGESMITVWSGDESITSDRASRCGWIDGTITHFMVLEYPPEKHVRWINMYEDASFYKTREEADRRARKDRTECIKIEYLDGEGL